MPDSGAPGRMREIIDRLSAISGQIGSEQTADAEVEKLTREAADLTAEAVKIADARAAELEREDD